MKNLPFNLPGQFYRGNLHTHTSASDGKYPAQEVMRRYREAGYDFLAISDHFEEIFDYPVTDTSKWRVENFTTILGAELHTGSITAGGEWHILAIGLPPDFPSLGEGETIHQLAQRAADAGAFIGLCHPSAYGLTLEDARTIKCAHAIEIYNHTAQVEMDRGEALSLWDQLLNERRAHNGYATDDAHDMSYDCFGGWVHVKSANLDPQQLVEALKSGHYYSSQGPEIHNIEIVENQLKITCSPAACIFLQGHGSLGAFKDGSDLTQATFDITEFKQAYVRVTVMDADGKRAWSNPIWFS